MTSKKAEKIVCRYGICPECGRYECILVSGNRCLRCLLGDRKDE